MKKPKTPRQIAHTLTKCFATQAYSLFGHTALCCAVTNKLSDYGRVCANEMKNDILAALKDALAMSHHDYETLKCNTAVFQRYHEAVQETIQSLIEGIEDDF